MSTPFWRPWRDETRAEPIDEQLAAEARRAVRDFRTQQHPVMAPASGKLTREMLLKARDHVYEPRPLPVHPDEYVRIIKERREREAAERIRRFTQEYLQVRWYPWYDDLLRRSVQNRHLEPLLAWNPNWVTIKLEE